jgi:hypothetical protein
VRRVLGALILALLLPVQVALADGGCLLDVPETTEIGETATFTGSAFDTGTVVHLFIDDLAVGSGTVSGGGLLSVSYAFGSEGHFWVQMVGMSGGDWCGSPMAAIAVGAAGPAGEAPDGSANLAAAQILTTPTVVLSEAAFGSGFAIGPDDLEPAMSPEAQAAAAEEAADSEATAPVGASETTATTATTDTSGEDAVVAAPVGDPDGGTSVVPLALLVGLVAALLGLGSGWVMARRRS